jgi:hypothetical protein
LQNDSRCRRIFDAGRQRKNDVISPMAEAAASSGADGCVQLVSRTCDDAVDLQLEAGFEGLLRQMDP